MRTIIELPDEYILELDRLKDQEGLSRAELIRRAVESYLSRHRKPTLREKPGFGAWKEKQIEGITFQRTLRTEWEA
jgi:metal-responsive CopG/Arc/MetJ family transcriptional regulator